jgi:hypothetical protein
MATTTRTRRGETVGSEHSGDEPTPMHGDYEDELDEEGQDVEPAAADAPGPSYENQDGDADESDDLDQQAEDEHLGDDVPTDASAREISLRRRLRDSQAEVEFHRQNTVDAAEQLRDIEHRYITQRVSQHLAVPEDFHLFASHENLIDPATGRLDDARIDAECDRVLAERPGLGRTRPGVPMVAPAPAGAAAGRKPGVLDTTARELGTGTSWEKALRSAADPAVYAGGNLGL